MALTKASNVSVSDAIKRALFWQDLYSCLFVGTTRLLSHRDYEEFSCERFPSAVLGCSLPKGFERIASRFPAEFLEVILDLSALCTMVDLHCGPGRLPIQEYPIDNFQYCIESRLVDLLDQNRKSGAEDVLLQTCIFVAFLVTYNLSTGIWEGCFIPNYCASKVMTLLERTRDDPRWKLDGYKNLLLWILSLIGAMANRSPIRPRAIKMIRFEYDDLLNGMYDDWDRLFEILKTFVWSTHSMEVKIWRFWQELD